MAFLPRLVSVLLLLSVFSPLVASNSTPGPKSCSSDQFWYDANNCCLKKGGPPNPPSPPKGSSCPPTTHYWSNDQACCVPKNPPPPNCPPPQCSKGWDWYPNLKKCLPTPTPPSPPPSHPSGGSGNNNNNNGNNYNNGNNNNNNGHNSGYGWKKRDLKTRKGYLCPSGLDACPITGSLEGGYECIDTVNDLESCGGCVATGKGQDCTAIPGAWNVGCEQGTCAVYTCAFGYRHAPDGKSCVPV